MVKRSGYKNPRMNRREWIGNDRHLVVKRDKREHIERDEENVIKRDQIEEIDRDHHLLIKGKEAIEIQGSRSLKVTGDVNEKFDANTMKRRECQSTSRPG